MRDFDNWFFAPLHEQHRQEALVDAITERVTKEYMNGTFYRWDAKVNQYDTLFDCAADVLGAKIMGEKDSFDECSADVKLALTLAAERIVQEQINKAVSEGMRNFK